MPTALVSDIIQEARIKTDYVDSNFVTDAELVIILNRARKSLFTQITDKCPSAYFITTTTVSLDSNGDGTLPSDFFKARTIEGRSGSGTYVHLDPRSLSEATDIDTRDTEFFSNVVGAYYTLHSNQIHVYPAGSATEVRIRYNAIPADITATTDTIVTIFHEDGYLVSSLCEFIARKDESDSGTWTNERYEIMKEIITTYKPDKSYPKKVVDTRNRKPARFNRRRGRQW